ncbi:xanthine dehydrogenase family protein molybdopterin-binding subunit [Sabulicella rubraurantiaca]|uniref:xanthine dehydrogenase family protein molybdopterin-binding subunit n=1 Tax=Sabulicella rubraurantiaca TaxID=2811429 RepID=UPI001A97A292|nr:xanthine dehydrogenase family protein molybdopterin-binding subunit [Sabulicella rubraurantiaca]
MDGIGARLKRFEDPALLRGEGRFAADLDRPGQLHMRVVRSSIAHGLLRGVDASAALALPGVAAVWTERDVADIPRIGFRMMGLTHLEPYRQPILAQDRVRYVGEPVAVVFAEDPYLAEDAEELVLAEIEPLPVLLSATEAPRDFSATHGTEAAVLRKSYGDLDAAFAAAAHVVELELSVGRHSGVPLETRGALAYLDEEGVLRMLGAAKVPHANRLALARMLGLDPAQIHLHEGHVGGGFGIRGELYPEDALACLATLRLGRPVKWIEDRREHLMAANHSRQQTHRIRAAVDAVGFVLGADVEFFHDQGGYVRTHAVTVPDLAAAMLPGPYVFPAYRAVGHVRLTNKTPGGTYRAPGRYESSFVRERLMDAVAERLGRDPVEIRRINLIPREAMPFDRGIDTLGTPLVYDSGDYEKLLDKTLRHVGWEALQARLAERRARGERVGAGLALFVEKSGLGPFDDVRIELDRAGRATIATGAASVGQGVATALAQVGAEALGIPAANIRVIHGQTDAVSRGMGAFATRVTVMTGTAIAMAGEKLRQKLIAQVALLLQRPADRLELVGGVIRATDGSGASVAIGDAVAACLAETGGDALCEEASFESHHMTYPYGVHMAVARVDVETGGVVLERLMAGYDMGRAVNPMLVEGQIAGGLAQGLGGALLEEFRYDAEGQPLSITLADYLMPTANETPEIDVLLTEDAPSGIGLLGVKGAGEGGTTAVGAAIAAAVDAALGGRVFVSKLPISPAQLRRWMGDSA